ncbi:MAG: 16S rRNA (guanine(527)-N(7))-methyltransferase RsmG [Clostridiales bacterium]|nr:16S rRNA (guanine(527)-N(7))-methyltransferase RsmG [Clostridiales bacterium]
MIDRQRLIHMASVCGITLNGEQAALFDRYAVLLREWNEKMNLTAITSPEEIEVKHFVDSLTVLDALPPPKERGGPLRFIDVGTGAGFPGVVLKLMRPDLELTLLDSLNKRLVFLKALCADLGVEAVLVHARAEEAGRQKERRESYDIATARAVAALPTLCEYCLPLVRTGGRFLAMKGPDGDREAREAETAIIRLGGRLSAVDEHLLPGTGTEAPSSRKILRIDKISSTPDSFPRQTAKIARQPL